MMTRFRSADEFQKALMDNKFPCVLVPVEWTFGGIVRAIQVDGMDYLDVKGEHFPIFGVHEGYKAWIVGPQE